MKNNDYFIIKNVDGNLVNHIDGNSLLECAEGCLLDNYMFIMDDNPIYQNLLDEHFLFSSNRPSLKKFKYVYILESYVNPWSSAHTYIFTVDYLDQYHSIFENTI